MRCPLVHRLLTVRLLPSLCGGLFSLCYRCHAGFWWMWITPTSSARTLLLPTPRPVRSSRVVSLFLLSPRVAEAPLSPRALQWPLGVCRGESRATRHLSRAIETLPLVRTSLALTLLHDTHSGKSSPSGPTREWASSEAYDRLLARTEICLKNEWTVNVTSTTRRTNDAQGARACGSSCTSRFFYFCFAAFDFVTFGVTLIYT